MIDSPMIAPAMIASAMDRRRFARLAAAGVLASQLPAAFPSPARAAEEPRTVAFADGGRAPALGQGSWHMASGRASPEQAVEAMRLGVTLGLTLIDTSDDYSDGEAERLVAKVIAGQRDKVFLVSKLSPSEATEAGVARALEASLKRLGTDHLDLYLLHFRGDADLAAAVAGFETVRRRGLTRRWGVSNFGADDMAQLFEVPGGETCATNQVLYNLGAREAEAALIPWCDRHKMPIMAYSPLGAGGAAALLAEPALKGVAEARGVSPAAVVLAWTMRNGRTVAVVESGSTRHVREDVSAATLVLSPAELATLDRAFPPPRAR